MCHCNRRLLYLVEGVEHQRVEVEPLVEELQHVVLDVRLLLAVQLERLHDVVEADLPDVELHVVRLAEHQVSLEQVLERLEGRLTFYSNRVRFFYFRYVKFDSN